MRAVRTRRGLTLVELVFVVAILAILAGFLVPRLGLIRNLAARAGNADQTRAALDQSVLYNIEQGKYPQGEDTLLDGTGAVYNKLDAGLSQLLAAVDFASDDNGAKSITTQLTFDTTGLTDAYFFNHDTTVAVAGDSGKLSTAVHYAPGAATGKLAQIKIPAATTDPSYAIYAGVYGIDNLSATGAPKDGSYLVAVGFGPNSELNGKTALGAPSLWTKDPNAYNRAVLLLRVYGNATLTTYTGQISGATKTGPAKGTAAATAGALSPDGQLVSGSISKYNAEKNR